MPITMAMEKEKYRIIKITGKDTVRVHLAELGFVSGETIAVISHSGNNIILSIKDTRIALGKDLANRIMV